MMKSKQILILVFALVVMFALGGCGMFGGGGDTNLNPTPTLPLPTNIVLETPRANETSAAPQAAGIIAGVVFNDSDGNGARQENELVIASVIVQLELGACPGAPRAQTTTIANEPSYAFPGLSAGEYCVSVDAGSPQNAAILGAGMWTVPLHSTNVVSAPVTLEAGEARSNVDFGWTFSPIGLETPAPEQPTTAPGEATPVPILPTPTQFAQPTGAPQGCTYRANFVQDVTIPDNTIIAPGAQFVKTWRVLNSGTCSWGPGSGLQNLQFVSGDPLGAPNLVPIPNTIAAGATGDLSINMVAPLQAGTFTSNWKLRADNGTLFGVGPRDAALYAKIRVQAAPPPTGVPPPPPTAPLAGQAIQFAAGATEAEVPFQLEVNGIASYTLAAQAGQLMQIYLSSNSPSARIAVIAPNNVPLPPQSGNPQGTFWQNILPTNGNYIIRVLAGNGAPSAEGSFNVTIPVRISFAAGAISANVKGTTTNRIVTYVLKASAGQTMTVNLKAPLRTDATCSVCLTVTGLDDGQALIRAVSGAMSLPPTQLPKTQDYLIQVNPYVDTQVNYTLEITVQ